VFFTKNNWSAFLEETKKKRENHATIYVAIFLCARWCSVCRDFFLSCKTTAARYSQQYPDTFFLYLDIEEDENITGDIDVDNFPTLLVFRNETLLHFKPIIAREEAMIQNLQILRGQKSTLSLPATLITIYNAAIPFPARSAP
jgi:thiol-disulfide isomerase/thioredoxin